MWGLLFLGIVGIGAIGGMMRNSIHDEENRNESIRSGDEVYIGSKGEWRRTDNGHQVLMGVIRNGNRVNVDKKTGEILKNYSQIDRDRIEKEKQEIKRKNKESKDEAKKKGRYFYSCKEPPIEKGEYGCAEDSIIQVTNYKLALREVKSYSNLTMYYVYHKRRTVDDLLIYFDNDGTIRDLFSGLIIKASATRLSYRTIEELIKENDKIINSKEVQTKCNMTSSQLRQRTKKIGAYIEKEDTDER